MIEVKEMFEFNLFLFVKFLVNRYNIYISDEVIKLLISKVNNDLLMLNSELKKFLNLNSIIIFEIIESSIDILFGEDIFVFSNVLEINDLGIIWVRYKEKMLEWVEINVLIG